MGEYKVRFKITTPSEYLDGKKIPNVGNTTLETVNASSRGEAIKKAKNNYKASNHYKNIMKNQDSTQSPKKPRVRVMKVYSSGSRMVEDLTDPTEKIDQYTKGGKNGGLAVRGWGIARHPRNT
jgi:hypothetical protein